MNHQAGVLDRRDGTGQGPLLLPHHATLQPMSGPIPLALHPPIPEPLTTHINRRKYKTQLCRNILMGQCRFGDMCLFAHDPAELRPRFETPQATENGPLVFQASTPNGSIVFPPAAGTIPRPSVIQRPGAPGDARVSDQGRDNFKYRTRLCKHYTTGQPCPFGDACTFAHGEKELNIPPGVLPKASQPSLSSLAVGQTTEAQRSLGSVKPHRPSLYKTKMCRYVEKSLSCPFGDSCIFAHSVVDLRMLRQANFNVVVPGEMQPVSRPSTGPPHPGYVILPQASYQELDTSGWLPLEPAVTLDFL